MSSLLDLSPVLFSEDFEGTEKLEIVSGAIPSGLSGTFYQNGPGHFQFGDFRYKHWLDGDGYIRALSIAPDGAILKARFIDTVKRNAEKEAGKPLFRAFGTRFDGDRLRLRMAIESPANVSVWPFAGKLLAFGEQALPWELDPETLATIGEYKFKKRLNAISPFSGHPKLDKENRRLCNFGLKYSLSGAQIAYWEFDENDNCQVSLEIPSEHPYSVHDYTASENFVTFYLSPYFLDSNEVVRSGKSIQEGLTWDPKAPNELLIFPRNGSKAEPTFIDIGHRGYCLHAIDAHETASHIILDVVETSEPLYPQYTELPNLFTDVQPCAFTRIEIDKSKLEVDSITSIPTDVHLDFPSVIDSDDYRDYVWAPAMPTSPVGETKFYDRVLCFQWSSGSVIDSYRAPKGCYCAGEPSIARASDGKYYLIAPEWDSCSNRLAYLILDPFDLGKGPLAKLQSEHTGNFGFHSTFEPSA